MHADARAGNNRTNNVITTFDTTQNYFQFENNFYNLTKALRWVLLFRLSCGNISAIL
jgi:hypothetical protein